MTLNGVLGGGLRHGEILNLLSTINDINISIYTWGDTVGTISAYASLVLLCFDLLNAKMITSKRDTKKN